MSTKEQFLATVEGVTKFTCLCNEKCGYCGRHLHKDSNLENGLCPSCGYPTSSVNVSHETKNNKL